MTPASEDPTNPTSPPSVGPITDVAATPIVPHPRQRLILCLVAFHVCALPWALAGTPLWSQWSSLGLAIMGFFLGVLPARPPGPAEAASIRFEPWPTLRRFPLFWIGLALLALVTVQALNPAWAYVEGGKAWEMRKVAHVAWLPTGVAVPFQLGGPWRMLVLYAAIWLTACTVWLGLNEQRALRVLCAAIAINGFVLAVLGLAQRAAPGDGMYWIWRSTGTALATFGYKNHGAIYLLLVLGLILGLAGWHYVEATRGRARLSSARIWLYVAGCLAIAIVVSRARGATVITAGFLALTFLWFAARFVRRPVLGAHPVLAILLITVVGLGLHAGLKALHADRMMTRLARGVLRVDTSLPARETLTRASVDMWQDVWPRGTGAGSFQFLFAPYQQHYPLIALRGKRPIHWEHAHNDIVEIPIELGLVGTLLLTGAIGWVAVTLVRSRFWHDPLPFSVGAALAAVTVSTWWDYHFQNPAILMLVAVTAVIAVRWLDSNAPSPNAETREIPTS